MNPLGDVAGETERSSRNKRGDPRRRVARGAGGMGFPGMGHPGFAPVVALGAIALRRVMLVVTRLAGTHTVRRSDLRGSMTVGAGDPFVTLVPEPYGATDWRPGADLHLHLGGMGRGHLLAGMAPGTVGGRDLAADHLLMVTEIAAPGRPEGESRSPAGGNVAGEAGK